MEDVDVVEAMVSGDRAAYGPNLHMEGDVLFAFGWWHLSFRLAPNAFMVRNDDGVDEAPLVELVGKTLAKHGLIQVRHDHPLVQAITYTEMSLAGPTWAIWSTDINRGDAALAARVGADSIPRGLVDEDMTDVGDFSAELEGARRTAGLPPSVILTVGLGKDQVRALQVALPACRFEQKQFGEIRPEMCGSVSPSLALIDAREQQGRNFIMELRAVACGRFLPVAALAELSDLPLGADVALDLNEPSLKWKDALVKLLP